MLLFSLSGIYLLAMAVWLVALVLGLLVCVRRYQLWKSEPRRVLWIKCGLALWTTLAMLTGCELFVALFYDQSDSFSMTNVSQRWNALHVKRNPQGYRDHQPFLRNVHKGRKRIVFLGDSFTFGHGVVNVGDRFSDRIGGDLERVHPGKYQVANLGTPGHGLPEAIKTLRDEIIEKDYQVDLLVYTICLNDIESFHLEKDRRDLLRRRAKPSFILFTDTYFFNLMYFRLQQFTLPEIRDYFWYLPEYYNGEPWQKMQGAFDEFLRLANDRHIDTRIVIFPFLHNLGPNYPFHAAHQKLAEFFRDRGVRVLDLEPVLTPHIAETLTVNRFDAHPNARAHQLAADAMRKQLLDDLFPASKSVLP